MSDSQLLRLARRMKRGAKTDDPRQRLEALRREMRGDPSPHRLAADEQLRRLAPAPGRLHGLAKCLLEHRRPIRRGFLQALVWEVERDDVNAARGERLRHTGHEGMMLAGAGPMR